MFDFLAQKLHPVFSRLTGRGKISSNDITETLTVVHEAFLEADVPYALTDRFVAEVRQDLINVDKIASVKAGDYVLKVVYEKLVAFFGGKQAHVWNFQLPSVAMVLGLQGSGKTTTVVKMAHKIMSDARKRGKDRRILVGSIDFYRPAAIEQLEIMAQKGGVSFYRATHTNPVRAAQEIYAHYKKEGFDLLFLDTAGRLHVDDALICELQEVKAAINPQYQILVLDAMTGQESLHVAKQFHETVGFQGAVLSKMDSDTRGGAAFAFRYALDKPIWFVGTGEGVADIELFYAERAASRMLGMGDMQTLLERVDQAMKKSEQDQMERSFMAGRLTLEDFSKQMEMVSKMGSLSQLVKYIPGLGAGGVPQEQLDKSEREMRRFRAILSSMTQKERSNPALLDSSRKKRVARGAGVGVEDINQLLQRFQQAQQYVKLLKKSGSLKNLFR